MTLRSALAADAARRLWARAMSVTGSSDDVTAAVDRVSTELRGGLGRWIGADGYLALVRRAHGMARAEHPALGGLSCLGGESSGIAEAVRSYGQFEVADGMVAFVAALIELLGRIIGDEMAVRLVDQTSVSKPRAVVSAEIQGGHDG